MRIGVLCSGGDAPGMNACTRAVVRTAAALGHDVVGILRGFQGLLDERFFSCDSESPPPSKAPPMTSRDVSDWTRHGGAFLRSSRSDEFRTEAGQQKAAATLRRQEIDALLAIGGDGTFHGCVALADHWDGQILGLPGTIDNDLVGTDYTIGFSTAVATAVEAFDKIRDTAESHERMFLVEVMGRHSGYIAVHTALCGGAELLCIPETVTDIESLVATLRQLKQRGKASVLMVVAEGDEAGGAEQIATKLKASGSPYGARVVVLGHLQRGGIPTPEDRLLATQLGSWAVEAALAGQSGVMIGRSGDGPLATPLQETYSVHRPIPPRLLALIESMSR